VTPLKPDQERLDELERQVLFLEWKLSQVGKFDMKTLLLVMGLILGPLSALWAVSIRPLEMRIETNRTSIHADSQEKAQAIEKIRIGLQEDQVQTAQIGLEMAQVGIAIQRVTEQRNAMHEQLEGRLSELWQAVFKTPMSKTGQYPAGKAVD